MHAALRLLEVFVYEFTRSLQECYRWGFRPTHPRLIGPHQCVNQILVSFPRFLGGDWEFRRKSLLGRRLCGAEGGGAKGVDCEESGVGPSKERALLAPMDSPPAGPSGTPRQL